MAPFLLFSFAGVTVQPATRPAVVRTSVRARWLPFPHCRQPHSLRFIESEAPRPAPSSGDCVYGLAQLPSRDGREVDKQVAAPAATRTPNLHRAKQKSLTKSADGRVATGMVWARRKNASKTKNLGRPLPFPPGGMVTDRSSPSRVRYAAKNAPLTAPGRSAHPPP